jgi:hypothetical protein
MPCGFFSLLVGLVILGAPIVSWAEPYTVQDQDIVTQSMTLTGQRIQFERSSPPKQATPDIRTTGAVQIHVPAGTIITAEEKALKNETFSNQIQDHYTHNFLWYGTTVIVFAMLFL